MRPDWLKCEKCLWFGEKQDISDLFAGLAEALNKHQCKHSTMRIKITENDYCENWTCLNCWETWDDVQKIKIDTIHFSNPWPITDHNNCTPTRKENKNG